MGVTLPNTVDSLIASDSFLSSSNVLASTLLSQFGTPAVAATVATVAVLSPEITLSQRLGQQKS